MSLSSPPLNRVISSDNKAIVQTKSVCPVNVLRQAELYFFSKLQTLIVRSALPEINVVPAVVEARHNTSFMWPEKLLVLIPKLTL